MRELREGKRAVELDPLSLIINADLGSTLMIGRRYNDAIGQFKRTLASTTSLPTRIGTWEKRFI